MPLAKLPFILSAAVGFHIAFTSPNVPPSVDESVISPGIREAILHPIVAWGCGFLKVVYWAAALVEMATVLCPYVIPSRPGVPQSTVTNILGFRINDTSITPAFLVGSVVLALGGFVRWLSFRELGRFFTFSLSFRKGHRLVTTGPYAIVRHPGYTGLLICLVGTCIMHGSQGSWLRDSGVLGITGVKELALSWIAMFVLTDICLVLRITKEDEMMRAGFSDEWSDWASRVPYCLIPGIY
ncbi:hypothetical protein BV22DRAFT_1030735 [Leucogyrophana mollusca]|uniref:Uncharacterized protein n=1 Tax=Leucogyrophana mollusca TaxID=85980 RepID=A0ACB8BRY2_9AGAM|nr:hypothetical protein BV22DRAFT_1030735 [Leucogyrophana mollusca]